MLALPGPPNKVAVHHLNHPAGLKEEFHLPLRPVQAQVAGFPAQADDLQDLSKAEIFQFAGQSHIVSLITAIQHAGPERYYSNFRPKGYQLVENLRPGTLAALFPAA